MLKKGLNRSKQAGVPIYILALSICLVFLSSACSGKLHSGIGNTANAQASVSSASIRWAFTQNGDHPDKLLIQTINQGRKTLDVAIYSLTNYDIVDAIVNAKKRGLKVRVITDQSESRNRTQHEELLYLLKYKIPILINTHKGIMHMKDCIIDNQIVTTGSFNYTKSASTVNDENLVILHDPAMAKAYEKEFTAMWTDRRRFTVYTDR